VLAAASTFLGLCNATSAPSANTTVAYFRGRAVLKACMRVTLDGVGQVVPVGTTLANLLEQSGRLMPAVPPPLVGVHIERGLGGAVLDPNAPSQPAGVALHLDWQAANSAAYGPGWGVASLPLLPGDRITLG
jgi:trimeric autotransporter adhesin